MVHCYYLMRSYYIAVPFMARLSSSYCVDLPFLVYSADSSVNCAVECFNFARNSPCGCSDGLSVTRFNNLLANMKMFEITQ